MSHRRDAETQTQRKRILEQDGHESFSTKPSSFTQDLGQVFWKVFIVACLTHELRNAGQKVVVEQLVPIVYDGIELDGYRLDMLVNDG